MLGLAGSPGADEVRAAYLRLVKVTKPDLDPVGFQALRAAYELLKGGVPLERDQITPDLGLAEEDEPFSDAVNGLRWLTTVLDRVGADPLQAVERIRVIDFVHARFPRDAALNLMLLAALHDAGFVEDAEAVLRQYLADEGGEASSADVWRWGLLKLPHAVVGSPRDPQLAFMLLRELHASGRPDAVGALVSAVLFSMGAKQEFAEIWRWAVATVPFALPGQLLEMAPMWLGTADLLRIAQVMVEDQRDPFRSGQLLRRLIVNTSSAELFEQQQLIERVILEIGSQKLITLATDLARKSHEAIQS